MPDFSALSPAVGIDLGATKTASVLITPAGDILDSHRSPTNASPDPITSLDTVVEHIRYYQDKYDSLAGIGIGTPGWHDTEKGIITNAVNIGWEDFHIIDELKKKLATTLPLTHATDAVAETLGEYYFGSAKGCPNFVYLGVGSGLGSGFFCNGQLIEGAFGMAGGIGHFEFGTTDEECTCGLTGCIEQKVGGLALTCMLQAMAEEAFYPTAIAKEDFSNHRKVLEAAAEGDQLSLAALEEMGTWLGAAASLYISLLNPKLLVIGGGLGKAAYNFIKPFVESEARKRTLKRYWKNLTIRKSTVVSSAAGAACLVWERFDRGGDDREKKPASVVQMQDQIIGEY